MSDTAQNPPQRVREDLYFEVLEEFLRTSAGHLEVDPQMPARDVPRQWYARARSVEMFA
jgi:hypothetical protein